jgi:hypothetical protein
MGKEAIIFFEQLGFGWVFDHTAIKEMNLIRYGNPSINDNSLMRIIENMLSDTTIA